MADYNSLKKCGFCGESIPSGAGRCPYCGSILEVTVAQFDQPGETPPETIYQDQGVVGTQNAGEAQAGERSQNAGEPQADERSQNAGEPQADERSQNTGEPQDDAKSQNGDAPQGQVYQDGAGWNSNPIPQRPAPYMQPQPYRPVQGNPGPNYQNRYQNQPGRDGNSLSNGLKVFLTILFTMIPGIGQVAGIITAIVFMSSNEQDRKSFGVAILVASLILFMLSCIGCFIFSIAASQSFPSLY